MTASEAISDHMPFIHKIPGGILLWIKTIVIHSLCCQKCLFSLESN